MQCRVCGADGAEWRDRSMMALCGGCHRATPRKVERETFDQEFWDGQAETVPYGIRKEFWDDYRMSSHGSVASYRNATREEGEPCSS